MAFDMERFKSIVHAIVAADMNHEQTTFALASFIMESSEQSPETITEGLANYKKQLSEMIKED